MQIVVDSLGRGKAAVRCEVSLIGGALDLASRGTDLARRFLSACNDSEFWGRRLALAKLVELVSRMSIWVSGCGCNCRGSTGRPVAHECKRRGCRARQLASRVRKLEKTLLELRDSATAEMYGGVPAWEMAAAFTHMLSAVRIKFQWVHELPFMVRQVNLRAREQLRCASKQER